MISVDVRLEAEVTNGGNVWIENGTFSRLTGESANYRCFYTFSSTDFGAFENVTMVITLDDQYDNITNFVGVVLPTGATYQTSSTATQNILTVHLASPLPAGQTGFIEFVVQSKTFRGPNGELIPSTITLAGEFVDGTTQDREPFTHTESGPIWEVQAESKFQYRKNVVLNGNMWVPDSMAYIVEYSLTRTGGDPTGIGSWGTTDSFHVDTLPTIPGVTPEVLYASGNYTVNGNQITWHPGFAPLGANIGVRYPKDQIDAVGGVEAVGEITNHWDVTVELIGGVTDVIETEVTHNILPIPPKAIGNLSASKTAHGVIPFPGNGLYYSNGNLEFRYVVRVSNSNVKPDYYRFVEDNIYFKFEDGTTAPLTGDDYYWNILSGNPPAGTFEYTTNLNPSFTPYPGIHFPSGVGQSFPPSTSSEYVNGWMVTATDIRTPTNWALTLAAFLILKQRPPSSKRIESIVNEATASVGLSDGTVLTQSYTCEVPFMYDEQVRWAIDNFTVREPVLNLGEEVILDVSTVFARPTSVDVYGSDLFIILPPDILYVSSMESANVTPNWNGTGSTLVHIPRPETVPALTTVERDLEITIQVSPAAPLGEHVIEAYYVINPTQAANPNIIMIPYENTAPDIYDFDQNGDTQQLVPYASVSILASSSNVVNVLKMSKSFNDPSFQINNDTQVTRQELFQYKFFVRNDSADDMLYVTIIDIFPYPGDLLGSAWAPLLEVIPDVPDYVTVFYSQSTTPAMEPIGTGGVNDWTTVPPEDLHSVKALKFDFGDMVFTTGESAEILLTMSAPVSAPDHALAYNSVSYIASARDSDGNITQYLPAFSPPAYARLTFRDFDTFVGDFVWLDENGNGLQDPGEPGINGITVQLFDENGNLAYEQVTGNHPITDEPGYYAFEGIWPQTYVAHFPVEIEGEYSLTIPNQLPSPLNSVADPSTGLSDLFTVEEGTYLDHIDAGYVSNEPAVGMIGDYVWSDLNQNGIQDPGEPGINGVPVELYSADGNLVASTLTGSVAFRGTTGYYEFAGIAYGEYYVQFPLETADGMTLTIPNAGTDPNINSKPDPATGQTPLVTLSAEQSQILNMDAGYIQPLIEPGIIGDFVWNDLNQNGIQDPGEPGINGVAVRLFTSSGVLVSTFVTEDHPVSGEAGYYEFSAQPGEYYVSFPFQLTNGFLLTIPNAGTDPNINSKPNPDTGRTTGFTLAAGESILNMDAGYYEPAPLPGVIGDFVWNDINRNGIQDPGEPGINGVTVILYSSTGTPIASVVTENHPISGEPGYYEFTAQPGEYYVDFPTELTNGFVLTTPNAGTNPNTNSKPNPTTGRTVVFTLAPEQNILNMDAGYYEPELRPGTIGDFVWNDLNQNGIQDPGEPGINGISVILYNADGTPIAYTVTENHPLTAAPGYYEFTVQPGQYYAGFPVELENNFVLTEPDVGSNPDINSKPDRLNGLTNLFTVGEDENVLNIDAGYIQPIIEPGIIGDFVWNDLNKNGIQDPGEPGINDIEVRLYAIDGALVSTTITGNHPTTGKAGYYEFSAQPGQYYVSFPIRLGDTFALTTPNAGTNPDTNSKPNPENGFTAVFNLSAGQSILDMDAGYVDEGKITITKCADKCCVAPCEDFQYRIHLENSTIYALSSVRISDMLDSDDIQLYHAHVFVDKEETDRFHREKEGNSYIIELLDPLPSGSSLTIILCAQVSPCACPQTVQNTASAITHMGTVSAEPVSVTIGSVCC